MIKTCLFCGKSFEPSNPIAKYCSDKCRGKYNRIRSYALRRTFDNSERKCKICGNMFVPKRANQLYCGENCRKVSILNQKKEYRKNKSDLKYKEKDKTNCVICGKEFYRCYPTTITCSYECKNKLLQLRTVERNPKSDREFYPGTVGLIHKWYQGGDTIEDIMLITNRSKQNILKALATPLTEIEKIALSKGIPYKNERKKRSFEY